MKRKIPKLYNIVFCEDKKSSKMYLEELYRQYREDDMVFNFEKCLVDGDYRNMILSSIKEIKKKEKEIKQIKNKYIVVDLDKSNESKTQRTKLEEFEKIAKENDIKIIYFDPNFESYLLLHFECRCQENTKNINQKLIKHINEKFKKHISRIDDIKNDSSIYKKICSNYNMVKNAINNNKNIAKNNESKMNFYKLVELIVK